MGKVWNLSVMWKKEKKLATGDYQPTFRINEKSIKANN